MRAPLKGSRISAAHFPHFLWRTPLYWEAVLLVDRVLAKTLLLPPLLLSWEELRVVVVMVGSVDFEWDGNKGRWISLTIRLDLRDFESSPSSSLEDESVASGSLQMTRIFRVILISWGRFSLGFDFLPKLF